MALAESVQAHRILASAGNAAARDRLPLVEALLVEITGADHIDEVLPPDFADLNSHTRSAERTTNVGDRR